MPDEPTAWPDRGRILMVLDGVAPKAFIVAGAAGLVYAEFVLQPRLGSEPETGNIGQVATRSPE